MSSCKFRRLGGSWQFMFESAAELPWVLSLDPGRWTALGAPIEAFNCDRAFLNHLDADGNKFIRIDDLLIAVRYVESVYNELRVLDDPRPEISASELNPESGAVKALCEFRTANPTLLPETGAVTLTQVREQLSALQTGKLRGDGALLPEAVSDPGTAQLFAAVAAACPAAVPGTVTAATLDAFETGARAFLEWLRNAELPSFGEIPPEKIEAAVGPLRTKLDEYFQLCELVRLDPANAGYFELDPKALPMLDTRSPEAVSGYLAGQPLARPRADSVLDFHGALNPRYAGELAAFAGVFQLDSMTGAEWRELKTRLEPFEAYRGRLAQDPIGRLGGEALHGFLDGGGLAALRGLLNDDASLEGRIAGLRAWEKAILFRMYMLALVRNFVSFEALFDPGSRSLIQAGCLIMDGRKFDLAIYVFDQSAHKKLALTANLCMVYVELAKPTSAPSALVAAVITCGEVANIYPGRPVVFQDTAGVFHHGKVVEFIDGPVSFRQSFLLPFRRLAANVTDKFRKYTDFSNVEKAVDGEIDRMAKTPPGAPPPAAPVAKAGGSGGGGWMTNGSMLMLAGGVSLAAVGSSLAFIVKSLGGMSAERLAITLGVIVLLVAVPVAIAAWNKLRKRNLSRFFAGAGWVVNLHLRLDAGASRLFSRYTPFPPRAKKITTPYKD